MRRAVAGLPEAAPLGRHPRRRPYGRRSTRQGGGRAGGGRDDRPACIQGWHSDKPIDVWTYAAKPTVFLAIDSLAQDYESLKTDEANGTKFDSETAPRQITKHTSASKIFVKSLVYNAAVQYAFMHSASLKFFNPYEDSAHVCDRDVFVYIGPDSKRIGMMLQDAARISVMSGLELRSNIEKVKVNQLRTKTSPGKATPSTNLHHARI